MPTDKYLAMRKGLERELKANSEPEYGPIIAFCFASVIVAGVIGYVISTAF